MRRDRDLRQAIARMKGEGRPVDEIVHLLIDNGLVEAAVSCVGRRFHLDSEMKETLRQETVVELLRNGVAAYDPTRGVRPITFFSCVTRTVAARLLGKANRIRAREVQTTMFDNFESRPGDAPDGDAERGETRDRVRGAVDHMLNLREREVVRLRLEGDTLGQIATKLNISEDWAREVKKNAFQKLRAALSGTAGEE
jgi:RNA polymerase sigma factor (sigma-70 family)